MSETKNQLTIEELKSLLIKQQSVLLNFAKMTKIYEESNMVSQELNASLKSKINELSKLFYDNTSELSKFDEKYQYDKLLEGLKMQQDMLKIYEKMLSNYQGGASISEELAHHEELIKDAYNMEETKEFKSEIQDKVKIIDNKDFESNINQKIEKQISNNTNSSKLQDNTKKSDSFEMKVGLDVLSKIGVILIFLGVITLLGYAYQMIPPILQILITYLISGGVVGVGMLFHKKKKETFGAAITGCGIGIMYITTFFAYFSINVFSGETALLVTFLISVIVCAISLSINEEMILALGNIGAYIAPICYAAMVSLDEVTFLFISIYGLLITGAIIYISRRKKWNHANISGFSCMRVLMLSLLMCSKYLNPVYFIVVEILIYLIYTFISYNVSRDGKEFESEMGLCIANNVSTLMMFFFITLAFELEMKIFGWAALSLAVFEVVCGYLYSRNNINKIAKAYYFSGILTNLIAPICLASDGQSPTVYYLIIVLILWGAGLALDKPIARIGGMITYIAFALMLFSDSNLEGALLDCVLIVATLFNMALPFLYERLKELSDFEKEIGIKGINLFLSFASFFGLCMYEFNVKIIANITGNIANFDDYMNLGVAILLGFITMLIAKLYSKKVKFNANELNYFISIVTVILTFYANLAFRECYYDYETLDIIVVFIATIGCILNLLVNFIYYISTVKYIKNDSSKDWRIKISYIITYVLLTQSLMQYVGLDFNSLFITFGYIILAVANIILGFKKDEEFLRKTGLVMAITSVIKLAFVDMYGLGTIVKFVSYIGAGIAILLISYFYQNAKKKMINKKDEESNEE